MNRREGAAVRSGGSERRLIGAFVAVHLVALIALGAFSWSQHRLQPLRDAVLPEGQRISCVSYDPHYGPGQAPYNPGYHASAEQIEADLTVLSHRFACVRTYSVAQGLDQVPPIARKLGMKVLLGAWINADPVDTAAELAAAIRVANENTDVVRALVVGNEVMLRREQTQTGMLRLLRQTRAQVKVPITYADVWEFWEKNLPLAREVDFATIHILPFWEDQPVDIDRAVDHVAEVLAHMKPLFDKPLLIGETGWPSLGRQREGARPSPVNQARYVRDFVSRASVEHWDYSLIEAVDQPWKRRLEGTVGGYWGMLKADSLEEKFSLSGPMADRDDAAFHWSMTLGGALLLALVAAIAGRGAPAATGILGAALTGALAGLAAAFQWTHMWAAYPGDVALGVGSACAIGAVALGAVAWQWRSTPLSRVVVAALVAAIGLTMAFTSLIGRDWVETTTLCLVALSSVATPALVAWALGAAAAGPRWQSLATAVRFGVLFSAATGSLLLWADSRYRDFPYWLYLVPAIELAIAWPLLGRGAALRPITSQERALAWIIALTALGRLVPEPMNPQAIAWTVLGLLLAWTGLRRRTA